MKTAASFTLSISVGLFLTACDSSKKSSSGTPPLPTTATAVSPDIPILPVTKGETWTYNVHLEIPADVTSQGAPEVNEDHRRVRTYIGKVSPASGLPEVDCFEVAVPGAPTEREFVEILDDRVLMRGSMIMRPETTQPMWLKSPVPFVWAGMKPGTETPEIEAAGGSISRKTQIVAREDITVPAGTFHTVRMLTTGMDGNLELKRSIWFAPGVGIIREEKVRYRLGKLIFRENQELAETSVKQGK